MFIIYINYLKPLELVEKYLAEHRAYLDEGYKKEHFIASGPRNPRIGGVILSQLKDRNQLSRILEQDPFYINEIASFELIEFTPFKYHRNFEYFT